MAQVKTGLGALRDGGRRLLRGKRVGLLCGSDAIRRGIESGLPLGRIEAGWQRDLAAFARERRRYLLYR
jgi:uncharacterized protein YbbC (DUF1343 family)